MTQINNGQWKTWAGGLIGLAMTGLCLWLLLWMLRDVRPEEISRSITEVDANAMIAAAIATAICYLFLSLYDGLALKILKKTVVWKAVIVGSFTAYTLSHNLGLAPITSTAARWRIYSSHRLNLADVIKMGLLTGIAFWLGVLTIGGFALLLAPEWSSRGIVEEDSRTVVQITGAALLAVNATYLTAIYRGWKAVGYKGIQLPLPDFRTAFKQNGLGLVEIGLASFVLWCLIPGVTIMDYPVVFIAYLIAFISVLITHAPGGVGVLEVTIIAMMPEHDKASMVAGLLLFRAVFHLIPLTACIGLLAMNPTKKG